MSVKKNGVDEEIHTDNEQAEGELNLMSKSGRVDYGDEILFDKAGGIALPACQAAEMVFQRSERADIAGKFDIGPPACGRQVQQSQPWPIHDDKPAGDDKDDEQQMQEDDEVGED